MDNKKDSVSGKKGFHSKYFTLEQLLSSELAKKYKIENKPNEEQIENLKVLAKNILDPLYEKFNGQFKVTSGFRSPTLNQKIRGSDTSEHKLGMAADLVAKGGVKNADLFNYISKNKQFGQLIWEFGSNSNPDWVHVSYNPKRMRNQKLRAVKRGGKTDFLNMA